MPSIDYKVKEICADHKFIKENYGFVIHSNYDCSFSCEELPNFNLSSYGDWGSFYFFNNDYLSLKVFNEMLECGIIFVWRINY